MKYDVIIGKFQYQIFEVGFMMSKNLNLLST